MIIFEKIIRKQRPFRKFLQGNSIASRAESELFSGKYVYFIFYSERGLL